ncbi:MAG: response regulator [Saprospiraceae bacterium]|nr:response regulator [Saprospiraceae bacterium]
MALSRKILLVEDNMADVELAKLAFESVANDLEIKHLLDGEALMNFLGEEASDNIGLILLDLNMPRMNGIEVLEKLSVDTDLKKLPVVVFTSSNHQADIKTCYELGANAYVNKPIDFSELEKTVDTIVQFWVNINVKPHFSRS